MGNIFPSESQFSHLIMGNNNLINANFSFLLFCLCVCWAYMSVSVDLRVCTCMQRPEGDIRNLSLLLLHLILCLNKNSLKPRAH